MVDTVDHHESNIFIYSWINMISFNRLMYIGEEEFFGERKNW
jgi:hypothetical protein